MTSSSHEKRASKHNAKQHGRKPQSKKRKHGDGVGGSDHNTPTGAAARTYVASTDHHSDGAAVKKSRLDPDTLTYLHEIQEHFKTLPDDESKELLVCNVLEELSGKELRVVSDGEGSRIVESLLQRAPAAPLMKFLNAFNDTDSLFRVASSPFGSHTIEKALRALTRHTGHLDEEAHSNLQQLVSTLVSTVGEHLYDYLMDRTAAYLPRQLLNLIAGRDVIPAGKAKADSAAPGRKETTTPAGLAAKLSVGGDLDYKAIPFPAALEQLANVILGSNYGGTIMEDLAASPTAGPFLQGLLRAAQGNSELLEQLIPVVLGGGSALQPGTVVEDRGLPLDSLDAEHVRRFLEHATASRLVEVAVAVATPEIYQSFFSRFIAGQAVQLATHPSANFVLQAAIGAAHKPAQVKALVAELAGQFKELFKKRRGGVVAALAAASARLKAGQSEIARELSAALRSETSSQHDSESKEEESSSGVNVQLVCALACLDTNIELGKHESAGPVNRLSTLGCATLVSVLQFSQATCRQFTKGLLALAPEQLLHLCVDPSGSRVVEAFLDSDAQLGPKRGLIRRLQGSYAKIALKSFGSFLMEKCYEWADLELKEAIVAELVEQEKQMNATHWGPFLLRKVSAETYQRDAEQWRRRAHASAQVLTEFAEMFGTGSDSGRKGKGHASTGREAVPHTGKKKHRDAEQGEEAEPAAGNGKRHKQRDGEADEHPLPEQQQGKRSKRKHLQESKSELQGTGGGAASGSEQAKQMKKGRQVEPEQDADEDQKGVEHKKLESAAKQTVLATSSQKVESNAGKKGSKLPGADADFSEGRAQPKKGKRSEGSTRHQGELGQVAVATTTDSFRAALMVLGFAELDDATGAMELPSKKHKKQRK